MEKPIVAKTKRIVELDSLRALAAINLLLFHFTHVYQVKYGYTSPLGFEFPYGKYGVQLFFMLSGFVNAMTLLRKRVPSEFLASRFIRIFPSFWIVLAVNAVLLSFAPLCWTNVSPSQWAANLTILPNLFGAECIEPVTWTLQVEILFYGILLALFVTGSLNTPVRTMVSVLALAIAVCLPVKLSWVAGGPTYELFKTLDAVLILTYMPLFFIGILLNEIKNDRGSKWANIVGIIFSASVFHLLDTHDHNPAATLLMVGLLAFSAYGKVPFLRLRPLVFISAISYSLYLLHNNLGCTIIYHLNQNGVNPLASMIIATVAIIIICSITTYWVERPISAWLRRRWDQAKRFWNERSWATKSKSPASS